MLKHLGRVSLICLIGAGFILCSNICVDDASALGLGGYLTYGVGDSDFDEPWDDDEFWDELESSGDAEYLGGGFILDTAVAKDKVFNYRLQIGYENAEYDLDDIYNNTDENDISDIIDEFELDIDRFVIDNTFGFGIVRKQFFRLWIGPQIRVGYMSGDGELEAIDGTKVDLDYEGIIGGIAPVIGANFNLKSNITLGLDLGYRWSVFVGSLDKKGLGIDESGEFYGTEDTFFMNFALIFRINDNF